MRILRTILTTKHLLLNPKRFSPPSLISLRPLPNPRFSRYSHSASSSQEDLSNVKSWSRYGVIYRDNSDDDGQKQKNRSDFGGKVENERADDHDFHNLITTYPIGTEQSGIEAKEANTVLGVEQGSGGGGGGGIEVKEANSFIGTEQGGVGGGGGGITSRVGSKRKVKGKTNWVCSDCGYTSRQWWGVCRSCNASGTMKEFHEAKSSDGGKVSGFSVSENVVGSWLPQQASELRPLRLTEVSRGLNHKKWRITFSGPFGNEVSRVLGGGLVPGSLILVGGDPGVGKSTLLLQIAAMIAEGFDRRGATPVIYVSGEESVEQIVNRADRLGIKSELYLYSSTDIEDILEKIQNPTPRALIVDSIQTVYLKGVMGSAGGVAQVKECTSALLRYAKKTNTPVFLIGHVTKSGDIAGPRVLEHIVDVVLYMEGEKYSSHRMLRVVKNRFGSTDELGVFEMSQSGLQAVSNASEIFLSEQYLDSDYLAGLAVAVIMDGSRAFLIEIQALCVSGSTVQRHVNGVQASRADMIISVLIKQVGLHLQENAVFLNVVSGLTLPETAGDLAIAAAICSSFLEFPLPNDIAFIGEIGLGGELRSVPRMDKRINTVAKLGYRSCIVPKAAEKALGTEGFGKMKIVGCRNLKEVINTVFTKQ